MAQDITDIEILKKYISQVIRKAEHHANNVENIVLALVGAIIWKKDDDPIEVLTRDGKMKNVLWVKINGQKYAFSYNHDNQEVEIRQDSTQGDVIQSFSNSTTLNQIKEFFNNL